MRISDWSSDVCSSDLQIEEGSRVIGDAIDEQALATTNIATSTDQVAAGAEEMSRVVEGLREQTGEAEQAAAQVTSMAGELADQRSEEHTSELQSLMRISYAVFCLKKKTNNTHSIYIKTQEEKYTTNVTHVH